MAIRGGFPVQAATGLCARSCAGAKRSIVQADRSTAGPAPPSILAAIDATRLPVEPDFWPRYRAESPFPPCRPAARIDGPPRRPSVRQTNVLRAHRGKRVYECGALRHTEQSLAQWLENRTCGWQ